MQDFEVWLKANKYDRAHEAYEAVLMTLHESDKREFTLDYLDKCTAQMIESGHYDDALYFLKTLKQSVQKTDRICLTQVLARLEEIERIVCGLEFKGITLPNGRRFTLTIKHLAAIPLHASFCEHVYRHYCLEPSNEVVFAANGQNKTLYAYNLKTRQLKKVPWTAGYPQEKIAASLTLTNGNHLIFTQVPHPEAENHAASLLIYSPNWQLRHTLSRAGLPPYGTQVLGQSYTGTVCYAEYADKSPSSAIWKSTDYGLTWKKTLEIPSYLDMQAEKRIRHFHLCQADPYMPGRWYATTGDRDGECLCYISNDDAETWVSITPEIQFAKPELQEYETQIRNRFFRTTAMVIDKDALYFALDDPLLSHGPIFVRLEKQAPFRALVHPLPTKQEIRSLIEVNDTCMVAITQHNVGNEGADVLLVTKDGQAVHAGSFPTFFEGSHAPVTGGYHSHKAVSGRFYTALTNSPSLLPRNLRSLEWQLTEESSKELFDGCPVCDETVRKAVLAGQLKDRDVRRSAQHRIDEWDYHCPHCQSRVRLRTLVQFLHSRGPLPKGNTLLFAASSTETKILKQYITNEYLNVAMHERENALSGHDMRSLHQIQDAEYLYSFACCVIDFIPEQHLMAQEMFRVLEPGGRFFCNIMPYRMFMSTEPRVVVTDFNAMAFEQYNYNREQHEDGLTNIPQLKISLSWIIECLQEAGFTVDVCSFWDSFAKQLDFWIEARKPT